MKVETISQEHKNKINLDKGQQLRILSSNSHNGGEQALSHKVREKLSLEQVQKLKDLLVNREYSQSLELLLEYYYNGSIIESWMESLIPEKINYKYVNNELKDSPDFHLYDISGIIILSYIIHCYICKNDIFGAIQLIKSFERACFILRIGENDKNHQSDVVDNVNSHFISWCNCFSIRDVFQENKGIIKHELRSRKHFLKLIDIYYFFRIQIIFWKLAMYKTYHIPNASVFLPENKHGKELSENIKIEDYFVFFDQAIDELYVIIDEIDYILELFKDFDKQVINKWLLKYKVVLFILVEALTLRDYYNEAIQILNDSMQKHFPDDISLYSLIARISLQYGNFPLVHSTLNTIEERLQHPKHNTNVNIAHYRFTLGLLNMAQDDPVTASLNFNTSAALYKELAINFNKEYLLPCSTSFNNLSVASFYSSKLPNSVSILENQIYNQNNFFFNSQQLFATNFKNLKTLYQFSSDKDKLINELKKISKSSLRYSIMIN
ncbi:unnamed protein product [Cryptosporidium hominis]|uniref:Uncharacterized protein with Tetratricopeptide-like helical n=1 Tax=Cryptosporidium hominis TaxID=237895 RepID=A0A0S4TCG3_CRYHO|nr:hypothetical protein ChTU502y2012_411g0430 [Cryptosporidium hominis]PPA63915.1 hypothetical protein ChUKH1_05720 [Cryptosporidium hominis]PPS97061.1 Uncharacterized protein with Tetratricopeptide-like helical [Cryptosporidium hominis]CUV04019.1 unnamed protein product [Cryptosporidium hominis]|eukprot:PPS97061.1 Uncharacterized protein with Tetratricopeptide-like helical [Cryptosporidium hominis]